MNDRTELQKQLQLRLAGTYDITGVSHLPMTRRITLLTQCSPKLIVKGYELISLIAHQRVQIEVMQQTTKDLEAVLYADLRDDSHG